MYIYIYSDNSPLLLPFTLLYILKYGEVTECVIVPAVRCRTVSGA